MSSSNWADSVLPLGISLGDSHRRLLSVETTPVAQHASACIRFDALPGVALLFDAVPTLQSLAETIDAMMQITRAAEAALSGSG